MLSEARKIVPDAAGVREAYEYLDAHGEAVEGVEQIRDRLQLMMDEAMAELDGTSLRHRRSGQDG